MKSYFLKRLLLLIPGLILISLFLFTLSKIAPGNPVDQLIFENEKGASDPIAYQKQLEKLNRKFHFDKPLFYLTIRSQNQVQNFQRIQDPKALKAMNSLAQETGNAQKVAGYCQFLQEKLNLSSDSDKAFLNKLAYAQNTEASLKTIEKLEDEKLKRELKQKLSEIRDEPVVINRFLPFIRWNGLNNQYHIWLSGLFGGDFGKSYFDGKSVWSKITAALPWTLGLSLTALILAFLIAIPAGVKAASQPNSRFDKICSKLFYGFYALPSFWVATLLIVFFSNPDFLSLFPSYGVGDLSQADSLFEKIQIRFSHLILPLFCWTYGSLAYLYRQIRKSMLTELQNDYSQTAYMKGLSEKQVLWKHAFKNASFPLITILGSALPALFSGSFIIEQIFSIPGMGTLSLQALFTRDYPLLFGVFMFIAFLTMIGIFLADLLYFKADPRMKTVGQ